MIRIVDKNERYIVQKVISVSVIDLGDREAVKTEVLRYQVIPVEGVGDASQVTVCDTLTEARIRMREAA